MVVLPSSAVASRQSRTAASGNQKRELARFEHQATLLELSSALSHEINQPLTAIMGYAQSLQITLRKGAADTLPQYDGIAQQLDKLLDQALRLRDVVVRRRSPPASDDGETEATDINQLVRDACLLAAAEFDAPEPQIDLHLASGLPSVKADGVALRFLIVGLIRNATEAMTGRAQRRLSVETKRRGADRAEIAVSDSGTGLPTALAEQVFHPFVTSKPGRLGLGLAICHRLVLTMGGSLTAEANPDGGTIMRVSLPIVAGGENRDA